MDYLPHGKPFIFKMLNFGLEKTLDMDQYDIGLPQYRLGEFNTLIEIKPLLKSNIYGKNVFSYKRFDLHDLDEIEIISNGETTIHELLPRIAEQELFYVDENSPLKFLDDLQVPYLAESEITNKPLPPFGSSKETYLTLVARPNSYVFTGQTSIKLKKP